MSTYQVPYGALPVTQIDARYKLTQTGVKTSAYIAQPGDFVTVDTTSGAVTVTLPYAPADKTPVAVKMIASASTPNAVTITTSGVDVINKAGGAATLTLTLIEQSAVLQYQASAGIWLKQSGDLPLAQLDSRYAKAGSNLSDLASPSSARASLAVPGLATANTMTADQYFTSGRPWFDVIGFGADPTGTNDSTLAIQTAFNTAFGLRTDTGVGMTASSTTVTDAAAVSGDSGKYVNHPNFPLGCSLISSVTPGVGYTVATAATATLSGQVAAVGSGSAVTVRTVTGPVLIPSGTYKVSSDLLIQSVFGFRLMTGGHNLTTLKATGGGFTTAILNIDGSVDGHYGGLQFQGDGTEGTGGVASSGIPAAVNLTWTTSAARSTSANTLEHMRVRALKFVTGISLAGIGTRQLDGTQLQDIVVTGQQPSGGWSSSARTDTGACGTTSGSATVTDTAAVTGDYGKLISGPGIPSGAKITAVTAGTGYTISANATATASGVTFIVGTGLWQAGFQFGNGAQGNIYDQVMYGCSTAECYAGYNCTVSSFALFGGQPGANGTDFIIVAGAQCTIENVQSQGSGQFFTSSTSGSIDAVSFRDCQYSGYNGTGYNATWISVGTFYGSLVLENVSHGGSIPSPVIALGSANYHAQFTLINVSQKAPPSSGIVVSGSAAVVAVNYSDTTAGVGGNAVLYPLYAINAGVLYQQGLASARPSASTYGELFYYATDTGALSHSSGSSWTAFASSAATAPDVQWFTSGGTWTKPTGTVPVTSTVYLLGDGGGGGSGAQGAAGTARAGGGGGAGGSLMTRQFVTSDLPATVGVTIGPGGAGGAAQASATTAGNNGTNGSGSAFGSYLYASGAQHGSGGGIAAAGAGGTAAAGSGIGGNGGASSSAGAAGVAGSTAPGGGGGAAGGGITTGNVAGAGSTGGASLLNGNVTTSGAGAAGVVDTTNPTSGTAPTAKGSPYGGAGSGAASVNAPSGSVGPQAGAAGLYGGGGGGGGASLNGNSSGAGGQGGPGFCLVISLYQ